jgi:maltose alpha-D-glucosyltransferase/alpha-amylase
MYEIYPQSFADSDGDGIGDLRGIIARLDYLDWLGVDPLWLNPCFASPMRDAGYDVSDYLSVAPRYGTSDDLVALVDAARRRGFQPALNFGYARMNPGEPWRQPVGALGPRANRAALTEIMAHWLDLGVAGFRVDLASTLVRDDPGWHETARLWREVRGWLDASYPDAVLMSEWDSPAVAIPAGFHADFYLAVGPEHGSLLNNGAGLGMTGGQAAPPCYFGADGLGSAETFLASWRRDAAAAGDAGLISLFSSDHDFARPACGERTADQLAPVFAFLLTWPTLPGIHCGDEIGMRFVPGLPD